MRTRQDTDDMCELAHFVWVVAEMMLDRLASASFVLLYTHIQ
jgi:hypothetical protein